MNKKASVQDVALIAVLLFIMGVGFFIIHYSSNVTYDKLLNNTQVNSSAATVDVLNDAKTFTNKLDYVFFGIFMGFLISIIITSWLVSGHPIFMWVYLLVDIIIVVVASILSFVWNDIAGKTEIFGNLATTHFPIMDHIFGNFPIYIGIMALMSLAIMYAKPYIAGDRI